MSSGVVIWSTGRSNMSFNVVPWFDRPLITDTVSVTLKLMSKDFTSYDTIYLAGVCVWCVCERVRVCIYVRVYVCVHYMYVCLYACRQ